MTNEQKEKVGFISSRLSEEALLAQLVEECGELTQVLAKRLRILRGENYTPVSDVDNFKMLEEESADVLLCLEVLRDKTDIKNEKLCEIINTKLARWEKRLEL